MKILLEHVPKNLSAIQAQPSISSDLQIRAKAGELMQNELTYYKRLLESIESQLDTVQDSAVFLWGSIGEGFNNPTSDIDLVFLVQHTERPSFRHVFFIESRRIEVFHRTVDQLSGVAKELEGYLESKNFDSEKCESVLHEYQQICNVVFLREQPFSSECLVQFKIEKAAALSSMRNRFVAEKYLHKSYMLFALGDYLRARNYMQCAVMATAKKMLAEHGEVYTRDKFIIFQCIRCDIPGLFTESLLKLLVERKNPDDRYFEEGFNFCLNGGVANKEFFEGSNLFISAIQGWIKFSINNQNFISVAGKSFFLLDEISYDFVNFLEQCGNGRLPIGDIEEKFGLYTRALLLEMHCAGLIELSICSNGLAWVRQTMPFDTKKDNQILVSPYGAVRPHGLTGHIYRVPLQLHEFIRAGNDVMWGYGLISAAIEDIVGGFYVQHWPSLFAAFQQLARNIGRVIFGGYGITPVPEEIDIISSLHQLGLIGGLFYQRLQHLEQATVANKEELTHYWNEAWACIEDIPQALKCEDGIYMCLDMNAFRRISPIGLEWILLAHKFKTDSSILDSSDMGVSMERNGKLVEMG